MSHKIGLERMFTDDEKRGARAVYFLSLNTNLVEITKRQYKNILREMDGYEKKETRFPGDDGETEFVRIEFIAIDENDSL